MKARAQGAVRRHCEAGRDPKGPCLARRGCNEPPGKLSENYPDLLAWVGEDELGSGKIGIKQGVCPAGVIPMVAVVEYRDRMYEVTPQMQRQATEYGKTIRLVRYVAVEEVVTLTPEEAA